MTQTDMAARSDGRWKTPALIHRNAWFPGRIIGGAALVLGPIVWSAGLLLRYLALHSGAFTPEQLERFGRQPFAAPSQLAAYMENPALVTAGYACFAAGALLLWPAFATLARIIAARSPGLAFWGGTLIILGLFARLYFAGVDQTAFQLAEAHGLDQATETVMSTYVDISYGPWRVPVTASACQYAGMLLLAIGAFRSGTFGLGRCLLFLWAGTLWGGVLKASQLFDGVISNGGLCLVLVPLGIQVLRDVVPELRIERLPAHDRRCLRLLSW
ncbi:hypothetical protein AB0M44_32910 [Streptosporangium subroseum]|uniref:hypothetical protein n=1 Tax=Streptosporangium subroseum TaxID=106412 RepID=UPI0034237CDA